MKEIWKDIKGYEGLYQVSNKGRIKSAYFRRGIIAGIDKKFHLICVQEHRKPNNYYYVCLIKNKYKKHLKVARLVAKTFIKNPEQKPQVNHIDGNRLNDNMDNLEWVTGKENMQHAIRMGLKIAPKGEKHWNHKLTKKQVKRIRVLKKQYSNISQRELAKRFNISQMNINKILRYFTWKYI